MCLINELCANGISLRVETRTALLDEEHLIVIFEETCIPMGCHKVFTNRTIFMLNNTLS